MQGREYLDLAREIVRGGQERHHRGATGRAYYAVMLECRDALVRWGFVLAGRQNVHSFVRLRFDYPGHPDLRRIGTVLDDLGRLRNHADYNLAPSAVFVSATRSQQAIHNATTALALLDAIDADPARRAAAVAAIQAAFP